MRGAQGQRRHLARVRRRTVAPALVPGPAGTHTLTLTLARSLTGNYLCGLGNYGYGLGTYSTEGITKLCEGLKGSAVTSLKCAAAP